MGSEIHASVKVGRGGHQDKMSWTWTGYDHDAVHRFKDEAFFQTGRNIAEARFWKLKIHEMDRRGTNSSIAFDNVDENDKENTKDNEENDDGEWKAKTSSPDENKYSYQDEREAPLEYHYSYPDPRDRSLSIVSVRGRGTKYTPSTDYQYGYGNIMEVKEEGEKEDFKETKKAEGQNKEEEKRAMKQKTDMKKGPKKKEPVLVVQKPEEEQEYYRSSRFY